MTLQLLAATRNPAKLGELVRLVDGIAEVVPLPDDIALKTSFESATESATDIETVAREKAIAWSRAMGRDRLVVGSDGGLLFPALGDSWQPSRTRRFAGDGA